MASDPAGRPRKTRYVHLIFTPNSEAPSISCWRHSFAERDPAGRVVNRRVTVERTRSRIHLRYAEIIREALAINPEPPLPPPGNRGRITRSKVLNMLIRLEDRYDEIIGFLETPGDSFDNNQAERDLRMMKVLEKISESFRSDDHADAFFVLRAVTSSAVKQGRNLFNCLSETLRSPENLGENIAKG